MRVIVLGYDGLPLQPVALPSPDYVPGPENPQTPPVPQDEDEHEFLAEEQPLPGHVTESDPEEDPEEYELMEPACFPTGGIVPGLYHQPSTKLLLGLGSRPTQTSISLPPEAEVERLLTMTTQSPSPPISLSAPSAGECLSRCMAPHAHSPPLPPSSMRCKPNPDTQDRSTLALIVAVTGHNYSLLHYHHTSILYPYHHLLTVGDIPESGSPPAKKLLSCHFSSRYEIGESSGARPTRGQGIDYGFVSTVDAEERRQGIRDVGYGIRDTWVDPAEAVPEIAPMTVGEVNTRVTELAELHERDTQDLYALLEDAQGSRSRISQRVDMDSQRVDLLMGDRMTLQETVWMVEEEAYASREAWAHSIGLSQATHQELQTHRDHVYAHETYLQAHQTQLQLQSTLIQTQHQVHETRFQMQQAELAALRETDRRRQDQMSDQNALGSKGICNDLGSTQEKGDGQVLSAGFQELTLDMLHKFVANETEKVDKYISGLPDNIYGNVKSARPKTLDETIELANDLMDQKLRTYAERQSDNKRKADDSSRNNHGHHSNPSMRNTGNTNVANTQKGNGAAPKGNGCFECGAPGHFKRDCPKLKNKDGGKWSAQGWVYAVGNA
ncbi:putative reverse transcriptase domain-containing protein [Tanacetum coccineum]